MEIELIKNDLIELSDTKFISKYILEHIPYIFNNDWECYNDWRIELSKKLRIDPNDIFITGSAALGISLNPHKNFRKFNDNSDIDVSIIAPHYFEVAWHDLIYTNMATLSAKMQTALIDHRERLIYWGTIATDKILPLLSFGSAWEKIIQTYKELKPFENHNINFRIYKNMSAIRSYISISISKCRGILLEVPKNEKLS